MSVAEKSTQSEFQLNFFPSIWYLTEIDRYREHLKKKGTSKQKFEEID